MNEKVSIIIPIYNVERYLERCLDSIISQTYSNIEIICVNDGSTDSSGLILSKYKSKDNRIIIISTENGGLSRARNIGIKLATGEFFMFIDSDDYIEPNMVEKLVETIKTENSDIVKCTNFLEKQDGIIIKVEDNYIKNKLLTKEEIEKQIIANVINDEILSYVCVLIIRKEALFKTNLFNEKLRILEDKAFFIELILTIKNIYFLDVPLYHYMINEKSITKSKKSVTRNIYSLLEGWSYVNGLLEKNKLTRFSSELNTKYLIGTTGFLYETYKYNNIEFKKAYIDLINNENFKKIIANYNLQQYGIHIKIAIYLIKKKYYKVLRMFYFIRRIMTKNRDRI